jgi:lysophospholipase L1-like esterase
MFAVVLLALGAVVLLAGCSGNTTGATKIRASSARLNAVGSCDQSCSAYVRWRKVGTTPWTNPTPITNIGKVSNASWFQDATGLSADTQYEYQACGKEASMSQFVCVGPDGRTSTTTAFRTKRTAIASLGDSYISGEAGRWQGNSNTPAASRDGTDRACAPSISLCTSYDKSKVYLDGSDVNGCHRSDVAEIRNAAVAVQDKLNIACSGAVTANIFRSTNGGQSQDGLPPQADQLASVVGTHQINLIALSIGGNDLGFASIVQACLTAYVAHQPPCKDSQQANINAKISAMAAGVVKSIDEIRAVMNAAGYSPSEYRLVLQSYPSVMPRAAENRYPEANPERAAIGGCPFYNVDSDWARDSVVPQISNIIRYVAVSKGAQFLDLRNAFQGREICSTSDRLATPTDPPSPTTSEWGRFIQQGTVVQGDLQEAFHPNAYGQRALGTCLALLYAHATGDYTCANTPGQGPDVMTLAPE